MSREPFRYPKSKLTRRFSPGPFSDYRKYKSFLRDEFAGTCVYCQLFDRWTPNRDGEFSVDHFLPKSIHPELETEYGNLFYACTRCNRLKNTWPYQRSGGRWIRNKLSLPNPCSDEMTSHLWFRKGTHEVEGRSERGRLACNLLRLNEESRVSFRRGVTTLFQVYLRQQRELQAVELRLRKKMRELAADDRVRISRQAEDVAVKLRNIGVYLGEEREAKAVR